jgi:hypothetical protein
MISHLMQLQFCLHPSMLLQRPPNPPLFHRKRLYHYRRPYHCQCPSPFLFPMV